MDPKNTEQQTEQPAETTPADDFDAFSAAFAEAVAGDAPADETKPTETVDAKPEGEPAPQEPAAEQPAAEQPDAKQEETPQPQEEDWKTKFEAAQAELAAKKEPEPTEPTSSKEEPVEKPAEKKEIKWYEAPEDEAKIVKEYESEWPEISKAEALRRKADNYNVVQYVFAEVSRVYDPVIKRLTDLVDTLSDKAAIDTIKGAHNDYEQIYDDVVTWAKTLPGAFKVGALQVMESGTSAEVSELIAEYKRQKGLTGKVNVPQPSEPKDKEPRLSAAAKKAAQTLQVVHSKRTAPTHTSDPNDFEGAWEEAVSKTTAN